MQPGLLSFSFTSHPTKFLSLFKVPFFYINMQKYRTKLHADVPFTVHETQHDLFIAQLSCPSCLCLMCVTYTTRACAKPTQFRDMPHFVVRHAELDLELYMCFTVMFNTSPWTAHGVAAAHILNFVANLLRCATK